MLTNANIEKAINHDYQYRKAIQHKGLAN